LNDIVALPVSSEDEAEIAVMAEKSNVGLRAMTHRRRANPNRTPERADEGPLSGCAAACPHD
jgi:hypothetical protein